MIPVLIGSYTIDDYNDLDLLSEDKIEGFDCQRFAGTNVDLMKYCQNYPTKIVNGVKVIIAPKSVLRVCYESHIHRMLRKSGMILVNIAIWKRHMKHYQAVKDAELDEELKDILRRRIEETNKRVGDRSTDLSKITFNDSVPRFISHDELHRRVSENPIYESLLIDDTDLDKEKFDELSHDLKIELFVEEIKVLFLERKAILTTKAGLKINDSEAEIDEIHIHFVTNLADAVWQRPFCLYHYPEIRSRFVKDDLYELADVPSDKTFVPYNLVDKKYEFYGNDECTYNDQKYSSVNKSDQTEYTGDLAFDDPCFYTCDDVIFDLNSFVGLKNNVKFEIDYTLEQILQDRETQFTRDPEFEDDLRDKVIVHLKCKNFTVVGEQEFNSYRYYSSSVSYDSDGGESEHIYEGSDYTSYDKIISFGDQIEPWLQNLMTYISSEILDQFYQEYARYYW